ncbi:spartin a isoform X2 [Kryptolebias marmoratus]|uniref:spartin a isoform X2 n=1 Tax=Kryptolebias marmoratus TaxID=37003 RepID=UPI000D52F28C|nr:spartin a isoform X2 [Kryptolebias marmoratus]
MAEPSELLLIKDQYAFACQYLKRGLEAEEAGKKLEAQVYYRNANQHFTQGLEVPTQGERHCGETWDKARQLQQKMKGMLETVDGHLSDLDKSPETTNEGLLIDLTSNIYPDLSTNCQPSDSALHHLYPTIPAASPAPDTAPISPAPPAVPNTHTLPAGALETVAMDNSGDLPPAYTPKPTDGHRILAHDPAGASFWSERPGQAAADGKELLFIPTGVQLFFVEPCGQVSSLSSPGYLRIITEDSVHNNSSSTGKPATLHVCDRMYPLTTDTPVLLANSGIFMLPDCLSETPGSYVGLVLSSELPAADCEMFQDLLMQLADFRIQDPEGTEAEVMNLTTKVPLGAPNEQTAPEAEKEKLLPGWSEKMAQGILSGATRLSESFTKGAEATGKAIHKGAAKIRDHITPEETPSEVSPGVTRRLNATKQATGNAVRVTQFLVNGMSTIAGHVADKVAPHIKKHGPKLVPESLKKNQDGRASNLDGAKFVAASSVQGFCTVWSSLETGAKNVCKSVAAATVTTVKYKFKGLENLINVSSNI